jgi:outer membrane protein TolC
MKQLTILVLIGILLLPGKGNSQEQYSLDKLLKYAVENSYAMKKAALQRSESNSKTKEVVANGLPQIDGSLDYSRMGIPKISISQEMLDMLPEEIAPLVSGLSDIKALHTASAGVTVSQLLYSQSYLTGIKQVKKAEDLYAVMLDKTEEDIIHDVSVNYYQILMNYSNLKILNDNIQNLEKLYNILKLQYENDFVKQTDVNRLKVTLTNLKTQRETLKNGIDVQQRILKIISGIPVEKEMALDTAIAGKMEYQKPIMSEFVMDILPEFQLLKKKNELAGLQIESDKAAFYPNLAAYGKFTYSSYATKFQFNDFSSMNTVGLKATIPIFSSGMRKNRVKQAQLKFEQDQSDFDQSKNYLETSYRNASNSLLSSWSNLQDQQENKALANRVYDQVKLQFDEGMASMTDLLNVETSLLEAESLFNQQLLKYKLAEIELFKATGKLKTLIN